ncbi:MAG: hypothetical protein ACRD1R_20975 [Acidobacteriota bacterium]
MAKPGDSPEKKRESQEFLASREIQCGKLRMRPDACYGCPDNPMGDKQQQTDQEVTRRYEREIYVIQKIHDAVEMGLIRDLRDLEPEEFEMLRIWKRELDKVKSKARMI